MSATIHQFPTTLRAHDEPKRYLKPLDLSFEIHFIKCLLIWMAIGTILQLVFGFAITMLLTLVLVYADGKYKQIKSKKE